jgi:hypothetical protein
MKLFHCIVVMGAAMGAGCGGRQEAVAPGRDDGGPDASVGGTSTLDAACETGPFASGPGCQYVGVCTSGTPLAPLGPSDCAHPQQLQCSLGVPCVCDKAAPLAPSDCPTTAQFQCDDWLLPCGCRCEPQAPASPLACGCDAGVPGDAAVTCQQGTWQCHSYEPPVGCECRYSVAIL